MSIEEAAAEIYGAPLGDFTAHRTQLSAAAKAAGDTQLSKAIAGLRKPTTAAWVVNMLARHHPERVDELASLGQELRDAQEELDAPRLRELGRRRSALLRDVTRAAVALAEELGTAASAAVTEEVAQSLQTAMIDPDAAALVASGTLVRPLTAAGWGMGLGDGEGGDVIAFPTAAQRAGRRGGGGSGSGAGADAGSGGGTRTGGRAADRAERRAAAEREFQEAEETLAAARAEAEQLRERAETVAARRATLRDEVEELARQLREAEGELGDAEEEARGIRRSRDEAKRAVTAAERLVARARTRVERLE